MLAIARQRLQKDEEDGFTLIELMVVVLIIAILLAIAIPTFLGAQNRARDRGAQSNLRNGITAAKTIATDNAGEFDEVDVDALTLAEGAIEFTATVASVNDSNVGVVPSTESVDAIYLFTESASGEWFGMATGRTGEVGYCFGPEAQIAAVVPALNATTDALEGCAGDDFSAANADLTPVTP